MHTAVQPSHHQLGFFRRYILSTDHKIIAKQYMTLSAVMALIGGYAAYIIRWQLAWPETSVPGWGPIGPDQYSGLITMHGTIMIFFVLTTAPQGGFGNFILPIQIGAEDMAFPVLNMLSFWVTSAALVVLMMSLFAAGGALENMQEEIIALVPVPVRTSLAFAVWPVQVIQGPQTQLDWPTALSSDSERGELYVANDPTDSVLVFKSDSSGDAAPLRVLKGPKTLLKNPTSVYVDMKNNEIWVANFGNHTATVYPRGAGGDVAPIRMIRSGPLGAPAPMMGNPHTIAYDSKRDEILVAN